MRRILAAFILSATATGAYANNFPTRQVTLVVTTAPGGLIDVVARAVGQRLAEQWGRPVVIENKAGGGHILGAVAVAKADPDGYTLMITESGTFVTNPSLHRHKKLPYDVSDFVAVGGVARYTQAIITNPSLPANNIGELIALAKAKPNGLSFATSGVGSAPHMNMALFQSLAGVSMVPVHYRGAAPALNDLIAGHNQLMSVSLTLSVENFKAGRVKMLGVGSEKRFAQLPDVPTVAESGLAAYKAETWIGIFAPRQTPLAVVEMINRDIGRILDDPGFNKQFLQAQTLEPFKISPTEFTAYVASDAARWDKVIKEQNLSID